MRRMLINAQRPQELRIAVMTDDRLDDYQVAVADARLTRGNIYRGTVASIQPSLNAAFVSYGAPRDGLLRAHDVVPQAYHRTPKEAGRHPHIERILERGKPLLVQVTKDPSGNKGAALTTNISLAGRYVVLMPYDDVRGISRKVEDEDERRAIRAAALKLQVPEGFGFIIRTNAINENKTALNRDLNSLLRLWKRIRAEANQGKGPRLLYSDQDLIVQAVRDMLSASVDEVIVDTDEAYERAKAAMRAFMPRTKIKLVRYRDRLPLFSRFHLEEQLERIFEPTVTLPSGGSIVIEGTEALTSIDVNSGRSTRAGSQEETAFATNLEAVQEVARQLRLRDIGGLIVVDLIDMRSSKHQREVEKAMREAVKTDRARVNVGRISPNGLMEINRQRLKTPLVLRTHRVCPTCGGRGRIPSPETVSLSVMRRIEERSATGDIAGVRIRLHPELADAFQNNYRAELAALEAEHGIRVEIIAQPGLHRSEEEIQWIKQRTGEDEAKSPDQAAVRVTDLTTGGGTSRHEPEEPKSPTAGDEAKTPAEAKPRKRRRPSRRRKKPAPSQDAAAAAP
ncbi:MAG: Rne/Rng family ribonuclease, partial [Acidobacteria bacterium]|nr:Rne/Rng family ribonuclease [Acidobacteriota bacterium]